MKPFFSIICPVYNREILIKSAIESVQSQTYSNWELIIIDDGSTDHTKQTVEAYLSDNRIKYFYQTNQGQSVARNTGIKNAKGNFICFLDSDDYYLKTHLENFENCITKNNYVNAIYFSGFLYSHHNRNFTKSALYSSEMNTVHFVLTNFISLNSVCIPINCINKIRFDRRWQGLEDVHFLTRLMLNYSIIQFNGYSCVLRDHFNRGSYSIYYSKDILKTIQNHVSTLNDLFTNYDNDLQKYVDINSKHFLVSEKYIHHANGALVHGLPVLSLSLIFKAILEDKEFKHKRLYLRYFLKYPLFSVYYSIKKLLS